MDRRGGVLRGSPIHAGARGARAPGAVRRRALVAAVAAALIQALALPGSAAATTVVPVSQARSVSASSGLELASAAAPGFGSFDQTVEVSTFGGSGRASQRSLIIPDGVFAIGGVTASESSGSARADSSFSLTFDVLEAMSLGISGPLAITDPPVFDEDGFGTAQVVVRLTGPGGTLFQYQLLREAGMLVIDEDPALAPGRYTIFTNANVFAFAAQLAVDGAAASYSILFDLPSPRCRRSRRLRSRSSSSPASAAPACTRDPAERSPDGRGRGARAAPDRLRGRHDLLHRANGLRGAGGVPRARAAARSPARAGAARRGAAPGRPQHGLRGVTTR
jgi:hypothetical protein